MDGWMDGWLDIQMTNWSCLCCGAS